MPIDLGQLRRVVKECRVQFDTASVPENWPKIHFKTFENISKLIRVDFETYSEEVNFRPSDDDEPWRKQTKRRARTLAERTRQLCEQQRSEIGWRLNLENVVLGRLSVEVACPDCRARVWRSEIEASLDNWDASFQDLEQRRLSRKPCKCPCDRRLRDMSEIGTNVLFDERADEEITYDSAEDLKLPVQRPDRIYGLQETRNFQEVLSRIFSTSPEHNNFRVSPFRSQTKPLLFPFLLLEAKKESSLNGFEHAQLQSALPLRALLKLQRNLRDRCQYSTSDLEPFVWFLSNRGDTWKVYGGYVDNAQQDAPVFKICDIWTGSVKYENDALRLLLVVDYIMDWARDIYRPWILRSLKSLAVGKVYDDVSLLEDSDILSLRRKVSNWIPAPPTIANTQGSINVPLRKTVPPLNHQSLVPFTIPHTKLGSLRSATIANFRFSCLYITLASMVEVLGVDQKPSLQERDAIAPARKLLRIIGSWDHIMLLSKQQLDLVEARWTKAPRRTSEVVSVKDEFFVAFEFATYLDVAYNIVNELSCFALSKDALEHLALMATYQRDGSLLHALKKVPRGVRCCEDTALLTCIKCLRSGSPIQKLAAASASTLLAIYPLCEPSGSECLPPTQTLGLKRLFQPQVKAIIHRYVDAAARQHRYKKSVKRSLFGNTAIHRQNNATKPSFHRLSTAKLQISEDDTHQYSVCERCQGDIAYKHILNERDFQMEEQCFTSGLRAALVVSLKGPSASHGSTACNKFMTCLFFFDARPNRQEDELFPVVVEDLLQHNEPYHTILHSVSPLRHGFSSSDSQDLLWNLPSPKRSCLDIELSAVKRWLAELSGKELSRIPKLPLQIAHTDIWEYTQMILHCLQSGMTVTSAESMVKTYCLREAPRQDLDGFKEYAKAPLQSFELLMSDSDSDE
ncbi:MAG: hypothetical protein Q9227_009299 [Pyrenula ochraceoflavens]